jgi:tripartite motif-containing protein 71
MAVDNSGDVYVVEYGNDRIQKFSGNGQFLTKWGRHGGGDGNAIDVQRVINAALGILI